MVTQGNIDAIRSSSGRFFPPVDAEALAARKRAALIASLPDWDSRADTILQRSLLPESLQLQAEFETQHANILRSLILFAQGIDLDVHGLEFPALLRREGESDDDYLVRLVNRYTLLSLGSLKGYEDDVRQLVAAADDVVAVEHPVSRNVTIFTLTADAEPLTMADKGIITAHYQRRDSHIAGISVRQLDPMIVPFYVHVLGVYAPRQQGAADVVAAIQASVGAYLDRTERIGAAVWSGEMHESAEVAQTISVGLRIIPGAPDVVDIAPKTLLRRTNGVWETVATDVEYATAAPVTPANGQWLVVDRRDGGAFNTRGQTFAPAPQEAFLYQYQANIASWQRTMVVIPGSPGSGIIGTAHVNTAGFLDLGEISDNAAYLFVEGYPALSNAMSVAEDDLVDNEPMPALAPMAAYAAAVRHTCPRDRIFVTAEAYQA